MSRVVICDNCGDTDDWTQNGRPFFPDGVVLEFRDDNGGDEFVATLELCERCTNALLTHLPNVHQALEGRLKGATTKLKPLKVES